MADSVFSSMERGVNLISLADLFLSLPRLVSLAFISLSASAVLILPRFYQLLSELFSVFPFKVWWE